MPLIQRTTSSRVFAVRNNAQQVDVSDIDLAAEFHTTPVTRRTAETVPR